VTIAGVVHHDFHRTPLHEALRQITGRVVRGEIGNQRLSARVKYRTELPWEDRVRPVLTALRLRGEPGQATGTKTRYVFTHDGRELPQSRLPRGGSSVIEDTPSGHRFTFERTALLSVVANVFRNSSGTGFNAGLDTLEFQWTGRPEQSPFRHRVDLRAESSGTWEENLDVLRNQFGVRVERVEMPVVYPTLALRAAERQP